MLLGRILFRGDGKEEILATLNLTVFFAYLLASDLRDGNNQSLQRYHFKQVTSKQRGPLSNWILINNNFVLIWKSPCVCMFSGSIYTSVVSLVLVHVREHVCQGAGPAWCPCRFWSEGNKQKLLSPWNGRRTGGRQTLKKLKGPWGPFLESQNISLVVHHQQMGRQWVAVPLVVVPELRGTITSSTHCVI